MIEKNPQGRPRKPRPDTLEGRLGERVEGLRKAKGWDLQQLADQAGLGRGTAQRVEAGTISTTIATVAAIAKGLGITPAELMKKVEGWK